MKELQDILTAWDALRRQGQSAALATVVTVQGSSYRRPGARMLIAADGLTVGSVSGGCLEADVVQRAQTVLQSGEADVVTYDTTEDTDIVFGVGLGCRGVIQILIERLRPENADALDLPAMVLSRREPGVLATAFCGGEDIPVGCRFLLRADGTVFGDCPGDAVRDTGRDVLARGRSARATIQGADFFLEYLPPPLPLLIYGAGHDAPPLVRLAKELGWHVTVTDARPAHASADRLPQADSVVVCPPTDVPVPGDGRAAVVLMTHNYLHDRELLRRLLPSPARYVGVLGPKRRTERLLADLREEGLTPTAAQLGRLHSPIGLDIGADTPESIALAIVAEIQAVASARADLPPPGGGRRGAIGRGGMAAMPGFGLIVLAAGASTRLGRPKQLLAYQGKSLLRHVAGEAVASACRPVLVVLGAEAARLAPELAGLPVRVVENAEWERGMGSSVRAGVRALQGEDVDGVVLLVCDQPRVTRRVVDGLVAAATFTDSPLAACEYGGTLGVPALFRRALFPELLALDDSGGAKPLLRRHGSVAARVPFPGGAQDVDTPEDAARLNEPAS